MTVTQRDTINIRRAVLKAPGSTPGQWLICMAWPYRSSPQELGERCDGGSPPRPSGSASRRPATSKCYLNPAG